MLKITNAYALEGNRTQVLPNLVGGSLQIQPTTQIYQDSAKFTKLVAN
jgi:hypothetical protein